jgi:hypothetical protein
METLPLPDCFEALGALGAVPSFSTAHFGAPAASHPGNPTRGRAPTGSLSKVIVSAATGNARPPTAVVKSFRIRGLQTLGNIVKLTGPLIAFPRSDRLPCNARRTAAQLAAVVHPT